MDKIQKILENMEPEEAIGAVANALKRIIPTLDEKARTDFVVSLIGGSGTDKVSSLVHL